MGIRTIFFIHHMALQNSKIRHQHLKPEEYEINISVYASPAAWNFFGYLCESIVGITENGRLDQITI